MSTQSEAVIDVSDVGTESDVHDAFARTLQFPTYYGRNWDAFWDVLVGESCFPKRLVITGVDHLRQQVPNAYKQLTQCFDDAQREYPNSAPTVEWH